MYNINRNLRAKTREALSFFINGLSISDMDSVRTQLGMLSLISSQTDEITRTAEVTQIEIGKMEKNIYCRASKFNEKILSIFYKSSDLNMNNMGIFLICVFRNYI